MPKKCLLTWYEFSSIGEAIEGHYGKRKSFIYAIVNSQHKALYVGKTSKGFQTRYRGGTHNAIDAAMDSSRKRILLAEVKQYDFELKDVEKQLIYDLQPKKNVQGKKKDPETGLILRHKSFQPKGITPVPYEQPKTTQECRGTNGEYRSPPMANNQFCICSFVPS